MCAPVIITVYDRLNHLMQCVESLKACEEAKRTLLYIHIDQPSIEEHRAGVSNVLRYVESLTGFKEIQVVRPKENIGSSRAYANIMNYVTKIHDSFIFLEDDVVVSVDFLSYLNNGLEFFKNESRVFSISAFSHSMFFDIAENQKNSTYFTQRFNPWGFAIWKDRYLKAREFDTAGFLKELKQPSYRKRLDAVGIDRLPQLQYIARNKLQVPNDYAFGLYIISNDMYCVAPYVSKSFNIGNDGSGERSAKSKKFSDIDLSFLNQKNEFHFHDNLDGHIDNSFHYRFFNTPFHRFKRILMYLGLYEFAYKFKRIYRSL